MGTGVFVPVADPFGHSLSEMREKGQALWLEPDTPATDVHGTQRCLHNRLSVSVLQEYPRVTVKRGVCTPLRVYIPGIHVVEVCAIVLEEYGVLLVDDTPMSLCRSPLFILGLMCTERVSVVAKMYTVSTGVRKTLDWK